MKKLAWALLGICLTASANAQTNLYVTATGNVGIGSTAPVTSLDASQRSDAIALPSGTTANRPTGTALVNGDLRYNTSTPATEAYVNGSWVTITGSSPAATTASAGHLQCSGANCANSTGSGTIAFCPYKGNGKTTAVQGTYTIPSACLTATLTSMYVGGVAGSSVAASTLYYIYLWNNAGTWVLDAETTGHATDGATGVEVMSTDNTKTLVGMIRTDASKHVMSRGQTSTAGDTNTVATWDNRLPTVTACQFSTNRTTTSTTLVEINSENRCQFMSWGDAASFASGQTGDSVPPSPFSASAITSVLYLDSNTSNVASTLNLNPANSPTVVANQLLLASGTFVPAEGYHFTVVGGFVNSGDTGTYFGNGYRQYVLADQ